MNCCKCDWCGELFWHDDPEWGRCQECSERDSRQANQERATEQWLAYIQGLRAKAKAKSGS